MELKKYRLGELIKIKNGKDHKELSEGVFPVYGSGGIMRYVDGYLYDKPSVLLPRKGSLDNIQYCDKPFWTVDTLYYTVVNEELASPYYLYRYLRLLDLGQLDSGTGVPSMTFDSYYNIKVKLPKIEEQKLIASVLQNFDRKIALNRQINATLESMAKQLYDYWFVQFDFPNEEGKPYKSSGGAMVWNEKLKREIPYGWEVVNVSDIANVRRGQIITSKETSQGDIKVVAAAVTFSYLNGESNRPKNTITVSGSGANAGFINFWREPIFASDCTTVNCNTDIDTILCLYGLSLFQERLYNLAIGAAQPHVYPAHVANIPTLAIPQNLKQRVSDFFCKSNDVIAANLAEVENLTKLRDELLPLLMNGQATVEKLNA